MREEKEKNRCSFCGTKVFEIWMGDSGLSGKRCKNKCLSSYIINQYFRFKMPEKEDEKRK